MIHYNAADGRRKNERRHFAGIDVRRLSAVDTRSHSRNLPGFSCKSRVNGRAMNKKEGINMKRRTIFVTCITLVSFLFSLPLFSQSENTFISKVAGGGDITAAIQTKDGNYAYLNGNTIARVSNASGKKISETTLLFEVPADGFVGLQGIAETTNGFVVVGSGALNGYYGPQTALIIAIDQKGALQWNKTFTVNQGSSIGFDTVIPTSDGGMIVAGGVFPPDFHPMLMKFSSTGEVLWSKTFESLSYSFLSKPSADGGALLLAQTFDNEGIPDGVNVLKISDSSNIRMAVNLKIKDFSIGSLISGQNQEILLVGKGKDPNRLSLILLNADGTVNRRAAYSLNVPDLFVSSLVQNPDGGYAIAGVLRKQTGAVYDGFLLKTDHRLKPTLLKRIGVQKIQETVSSIIASGNGGYLLFGSSAEDTLFVGINDDGLVPGCGFSHNLDVQKIRFGQVIASSLAIAPTDFSFPTPGSTNVTSKRSKRAISNVCVN